MAGDRCPGIIRFDQRASGGSERLTACRITQQPDDGVREIMWGVGGQELAAGFEGEAFGANRRRHHSLAHGERFENLDARSAASAQRHHVDGPFGNRRTHVVERAGDRNARL